MVNVTKIENEGILLQKEVKKRNEKNAVSGFVGSARSGVSVLQYDKPKTMGKVVWPGRTAKITKSYNALGINSNWNSNIYNTTCPPIRLWMDMGGGLDKHDTKYAMVTAFRIHQETIKILEKRSRGTNSARKKI